jgi:solute carrier family 25 oxoglutarate transporter 11
VLDLYTGLSAGLLRQAVYTTARLGFFDTFMSRLSARAKEKGNTIGFRERATAGLTAGGLAAMIGNPADLALIRMQSDGLKPLAERKNYKSVIDALSSIARSEGVAALWAGATPTVVRAMALNFGQLAFFSESKAQLKKHTTWAPNTQTLTASAIAGFFASFFSLPFDFVKTRCESQASGPLVCVVAQCKLTCAAVQCKSSRGNRTGRFRTRTWSTASQRSRSRRGC